MRIMVATYGTEGDARPLAALCRGLMDAGHEAHLLADATTLGSARALGVPVTALAGDMHASLAADDGIAGFVAEGGGLNTAARALAKIANDNACEWLRTLIEVGEGCDAVLAAGLAAFVGLSAAERLGVPGIGAGMFPLTPTAAILSPLLPTRRVPRLLNRFTHPFVNAMLWRAFRARTNAARALCQLPPRRALWAGHPMLYGISPSLLPRPADWPDNAFLCGQWLAPTPGWTPPPELVHFLADAPAPIYVGFGSMAVFEHGRLLEALAQATQGRRVVFNAGWSRDARQSLPDHFFPVGDTPHDWLFPRMAAIVHHGGSGTAHSAARAGVPSIVVPFAGDQYFWAERLRIAGVAPPSVDGRRPRVEAIARALEFTGSAEVRDRAGTLGEAMRAEEGVSRAVAILERLLGGRHA